MDEIKYVAVSLDGTEYVMGSDFREGLVADWPKYHPHTSEPPSKK